MLRQWHFTEFSIHRTLRFVALCNCLNIRSLQLPILHEIFLQHLDHRSGFVRSGLCCKMPEKGGKPRRGQSTGSYFSSIIPHDSYSLELVFEDIKSPFYQGSVDWPLPDLFEDSLGHGDSNRAGTGLGGLLLLLRVRRLWSYPECLPRSTRGQHATRHPL